MSWRMICSDQRERYSDAVDESCRSASRSSCCKPSCSGSPTHHYHPPTEPTDDEPGDQGLCTSYNHDYFISFWDIAPW